MIQLLRTGVSLVNGVLATGLFAALVLSVAMLRPQSIWVDRIARAWARTVLWPTGVKLTVVGRENVDPDQPYIIVANHQSTFDIMAHFIALPCRIRFLAKVELFRVLLLGAALKAMGMIPVDRRSRHTYRQIEEAALRIAKLGLSIIVYPEGTRTRTGDLLPFRKGAFALAVHTGLPILPTTIQGGMEAWPPKTKSICGGPITVVTDEPRPTDGLTDDDILDLRDRTFATIEKRLRSLQGR
jgi:1-acyl-sn-glycerol-3-phosphate acyltransferase